MIIRVCCHVSDNKTHLLGTVLSNLITQHCTNGERYLEQVVIVPDDCVEHGVNLILSETGQETENYVMGPHRTKAVAIPVETDSTLRCFIVLEQSLVAEIDREQVSHEVMSHLLEELLHINYYSVTWQRFGRLRLPAASFAQQELLKIAAFLVDEYLVGRSKALIISNMYYVLDEDGQSTPLCLWYGGNLLALLEKAPFELAKALAQEGASTDEGCWCQLLNAMNRYVFEPLARDAAFRAAHPGSIESNALPAATESKFYREYVADYWSLVLPELEAVFDTNLDNREEALKNIAGVLSAFLEHVKASLQ